MSTKTTFQCDICGEDDIDLLVGLKFVTSSSFKESDYSMGFKHICLNCIKQIKKISLRNKVVLLENKMDYLANEIKHIEAERRNLLGVE